ITRSGGLVDFDLPADGFITTSNVALGGWATVNDGSTYAKVVAGNITAFEESDYTVEDDPSLWLDDQVITDDAGFTTSAVSSPGGTLQLGGLRFTAPRATTVNIAAGTTLGTDGSILVASSVGNFGQTIAGGALTGPLGGGALGVQHRGGGIFAIDSQIVDNGADAVGFTNSGTGTVALRNTGNTYSGPTVIAQGTLNASRIANGGEASSIGASSSDPSNLVIEAGTLNYTGSSAVTDRGFTIVRGGPVASTINVVDGGDLTFTGLVTSPDDADFTKSGWGRLTLANGANDYSGVTTVSGGTHGVSTLANGGAVSSIGRSDASSASLVLSGGGVLEYTGAAVAIDRGFTLGAGGAGIAVTDASTTLTFAGV